MKLLGTNWQIIIGMLIVFALANIIMNAIILYKKKNPSLEGDKFIDWLKAQIEWIKGFLSEPAPVFKASSNRLFKASVIYTFLLAYYRVSMATTKMEDIPTNWALLIAIILGFDLAKSIVALRQSRLANGSKTEVDDGKAQ